MMIKLVTILCILVTTINTYAQKECEAFQSVINKPEFQQYLTDTAYQVQIIYTSIERKKNGKIILHDYQYGLDEDLYFYPASTIKLPSSILALQRLKELNIDANASIKYGADRFSQIPVSEDSTSLTGKPSIAHYIKKIMLVSDNDAQNRLFDFLGPKYIHDELTKRGMHNSRIRHRLLGGVYGKENEFLQPFWIYDKDSILYKQSGKEVEKKYTPIEKKHTIRGQGYWDDDQKKVINKAFDFSEKNFISLSDLHKMTQLIMTPSAFSDNEQFNLSEQDYSFLHTWMSTLPRNSPSPIYDYQDNWVKFILFGDEDEQFTIPDHIKSYNKVGVAYGFLTDTAYIVDEHAEIEFFLSMQMLVNDNQIFNDGVYEYEEGIAFMGRFGKAIYELERTKN